MLSGDIMLVILAPALMVMSIGAFCYMAYKRKENMILAALAVSFYISYVCIIGFICFGFENLLDYVFDYDFSEQFKILFIFLKVVFLKVVFLVLIPAPVLSTYYKVKRMERNARKCGSHRSAKNDP